jgi:hypothetical protein
MSCNASICRLALASAHLWALHSGRLLSLVVSITGIAVEREVMPGGQGASMVGAGIATMILYPAPARSLLGERSAAATSLTWPTCVNVG